MRISKPKIDGVVYGLVDPLTNQIRYVGQTIQPLEERLKNHLSKSQLQEDCPKNTWLKSLLENGLKPKIIEIEKCPGTTLTERENFWIETYRFQDCGLTNRYQSNDIRKRWLDTFNPPASPKPKISDKKLARIELEKNITWRFLRNRNYS